MKRTTSVLAICALLGLVAASPGTWAQELDLTTTVTVPAAEAGPVLPVTLEPDTIAAEADTPPEWAAADYARLVAIRLMPTIVYIVSGLLLTLATIGLYYLRKYTGIDITAKQFSMWQDMAGIAWKTVEERLRAGLLKVPLDKSKAAVKMEAALDIAEEIARQLQLPQMARTRLQKLIEAKLMEGRG